MRLDGRRVMVVGGSAGIGSAVAEAASREGASLVLVARHRDGLATAAGKMSGAVAIETADARDPEQLAALFGRVGKVDHVVVTVHESSTRLGVNRVLDAIDVTAAQAFLDAKFWSQVRIAKAALGSLAPNGSIVLTSGVASRKGLAHHTIIAATNAAVDAFVRQLAREIAPRRVNVVSPGLTQTRTYDHMSEADRAAFFATIARQLPVGHVGTPADVAQAYIFAMSCSYLSGSVIDVDGGLLAS